MLMPERLRISEPGMNLERAFECGTQPTYILEREIVEDFVVDNGPGRPTDNVAREVLSRASRQLRVPVPVPPTHGRAIRAEGAGMESPAT